MRTTVMMLGCLGAWTISSAVVAQNTLKTWTVAGTICGVRREGSDVHRFVVTDAGNGRAYDFSPSAAKWHQELCDRDPNAPAPSFESVMAKLREPEPSCVERRKTWSKMSVAERREVAAINARMGDRCEVQP